VRQRGFFDLEERLAGLSKKGDDLERLSAVVDFELFRPELEAAVPRADREKGGRPPFDHVLMFKTLILQTQNNLSDERTEFYLRDRLTWIRFLGLGLGDPVPDGNTIWRFREQLTKTGAIERLFELFDRQLRRPAIWQWLGNSSMQASPGSGQRSARGQALPHRSSATPRSRSRRSRKVEFPRTGKGSRRSSGKKIAMRAGRSSTRRRSRSRMAGRPGDPRFRLPEPHQRRSPASPDPQMAGDRRRGP
jgi:hypothetical protein